MLVVSEFVSSILVETNVLPEVVALKGPMVQNHPIVGWRNKRFEYCCSDCFVIIWGQTVANVVHQRTHHVFLVATISLCSGSSLQTVFESVNWVTQKLASQLFELLNYLAGNTALHNFVLLG